MGVGASGGNWLTGNLTRSGLSCMAVTLALAGNRGSVRSHEPAICCTPGRLGGQAAVLPRGTLVLLSTSFALSRNPRSRFASDGYFSNPTTPLLTQNFFSRLLPLSTLLDPKRPRRQLSVRSPGIGIDSTGRFPRQGAHFLPPLSSLRNRPL